MAGGDVKTSVFGRRLSPSGRIHVFPEDHVWNEGFGLGKVAHLDSETSHNQAKVEWINGRTTWVNLNLIRLVLNGQVVA